MRVVLLLLMNSKEVYWHIIGTNKREGTCDETFLSHRGPYRSEDISVWDLHNLLMDTSKVGMAGNGIDTLTTLAMRQCAMLTEPNNNVLFCVNWAFSVICILSLNKGLRRGEYPDVAFPCLCSTFPQTEENDVITSILPNNLILNYFGYCLHQPLRHSSYLIPTLLRQSCS